MKSVAKVVLYANRQKEELEPRLPLKGNSPEVNQRLHQKVVEKFKIRRIAATMSDSKLDSLKALVGPTTVNYLIYPTSTFLRVWQLVSLICTD